MICGKDLDEVFAYQTAKIVVLKDRRLGFISIFLKTLVFCYIFLWLILHEGKHLAVANVDGVFRLAVRNPTEGMCDPMRVGCRANYTPFVDLPYCNQSTLPYAGGPKRYCSVWDSVEASLNVDNGLLLPTRTQRFDQVRACEPAGTNRWSCQPGPYAYLNVDGSVQRDPGKAVPKYDSFIGDLEHFTLLVDHNFHYARGGSEDDFTMPGHIYDCPNSEVENTECERHSIPCLHDRCPDETISTAEHPEQQIAVTLLESAPPKKRKQRREEVLSGPERRHVANVRRAHKLLQRPDKFAVALPRGDIFSVDSLMRLARVSLDVPNEEGYSPRARGLVLVMHIEYGNKPDGGFLGLQVTPWHSPRPYYSYRVSAREHTDYKLTKTFDDPASRHRIIRNFLGIRVVVQQSGAIKYWDTTFFLITMTTTLGLMAVANTLTDLMLTHLMPRSQEYYQRKFFESKDFNPEEEAEAGPPTTSKEAGERFFEALEAQDGEAVAQAFGALQEFLQKAKGSRGEV